MKSFKTACVLVKDEMKKEALITHGKVMTGDRTAFSRSDKLVFITALTLGMVLMLGGTVFAADGLIGTVLSWISDSFYEILKGTSLIAAFCLLIAILWTMISPSAHGSAVPIAWIRKIIIAWVAILSISGIITAIETVTSDYAEPEFNIGDDIGE